MSAVGCKYSFLLSDNKTCYFLNFIHILYIFFCNALCVFPAKSLDVRYEGHLSSIKGAGHAGSSWQRNKGRHSTRCHTVPLTAVTDPVFGGTDDGNDKKLFSKIDEMCVKSCLDTKNFVHCSADGMNIRFLQEKCALRRNLI